MIEINLVPDVKQRLIKTQHIRSVVVSSCILIGSVSIAVVIVLVLYIYTVQNVRGKLADGKIETGAKELSEVKDLSKIVTIQNQLAKIPTINENKKIYSRIFDLLETVIPPEPNVITVSSLSVDSDTGSITVEGQAENSYVALEVFKKTIINAWLCDPGSDCSKEENRVKLITEPISTGETSYGEDSAGSKVLRFSINFICSEELFSKDSKYTKVEIIVDGNNVTDSYLGIPKSIFADSAKDITEGN